METTITNFDLKQKLADLQLPPVQGLTFIPDNLEKATNRGEFVFGDSQQDIQKLFRKNDIPFDSLGGKATAFRSRKSADWFGPTMFIGFSILTQQPDLVSVALNVLSNYVTDFFKGHFGKPQIEIDFIVETTPDSKTEKLTYKGPPEGLKEITATIKKMIK